MAKITLSDELLGMLEMALNDNSYMADWYLDLQEESVVFISEEAEEDPELRQLIEDDETGERFLYIDPDPPRDGWNRMRDFILSQDDLDETVQALLMRTIEGRGAFSRFHDAVYDAGLQEDWYEYKNMEERKRVLNWLLVKNLIDENDVEQGLQMLRERVDRQKRVKENMAKMNTGRTVVCASSHGHSDKITPGSTYEILDERSNDLLIRIKDDREKIIWLPKSHFELV